MDALHPLFLGLDLSLHDLEGLLPDLPGVLADLLHEAPALALAALETTGRRTVLLLPDVNVLAVAALAELGELSRHGPKRGVPDAPEVVRSGHGELALGGARGDLAGDLRRAALRRSRPLVQVGGKLRGILNRREVEADRSETSTHSLG
jgi:hypothetical protein